MAFLPLALPGCAHGERSCKCFDIGQERCLFHFDCDVNPASWACHRVCASILYLNEDFVGGDAESVGSLVAPKSGHVLLFTSSWCFPHCVREGGSGEKYVVVIWYYAESAP